MKKYLLSIFILMSSLAMAQDMPPSVLEGKGMVFEHDGARVVRASFSPEQPMKRHNHPGEIIILTVLKGKGHIHVDNKKFDVKEGDVLAFDGEDFVEGEFDEPTEALVTLVAKVHEHKAHDHHHHSHTDHKHKK